MIDIFLLNNLLINPKYSLERQEWFILTNALPSEWIEQEKESFINEKDKDKDGYLDRDELAAWVIPLEKNFSGEEAASLIEV